jgi:hypothetical protein
MFSIVVISVYLLIRLNFGDEKVIVKDVAAFSLFAILNYDVHWLFLNSLEESSAALAHFGGPDWHGALHSGLPGPYGGLVEVAEAFVVPIDVIES